MNPPKWFLDSIALLDPLLAVHRSEVSPHWVVTRKGVIPSSEVDILRRREARLWRWISFPNEDQKKQLHQNRIAWQALHDERAAAELQRRVICRPRTLTHAVYNDLCKSDFQRYGGYARFCNELETTEEKFEADQERMLSNKRQALSGEVYHILNFLDRKRGAALDAGHQDMNYLLHGRHSQPGDAPVVQLTDF